MVLDIKYIAGFIDGDGSITIQKAGRRSRYGLPYLKPKIKISNSNKEILELIKRTIGCGHIYKKPKSKSVNWKKEHYELLIQGKEACKVARILYPYLILKKEQAKLLIEFERYMGHDIDEKTRRFKPLSKEVWKKRYELYLKIQELNGYG